MSSLPRILTIDPTGVIPRIVRGTIDLMDRLVIQVDTPGSEEAIDEVSRGGYNVVITAWEPDDEMKGWEIAAHIKRESEDTAVIILADEHDPEMDEETLAGSPFVYLQRPLDSMQFIKVLEAGLNGDDISKAMVVASGGTVVDLADMGPVPMIDINNAQTTVDSLLADLGAMAILMATRTGDIMLERGAVGYLDREMLTNALLPVIQANTHVNDIVGGNASALQFYDGDDHDVFVLSIGLHHFLSIIFDGASGSRQLGSVNVYGRRAAADLVAMLGPSAWVIQKPEPEVRRKSDAEKKKRATDEIEEPIVLDRAAFDNGEESDTEEEEVPEAESPIQQLDPVDNLDLDNLFGDDFDEGDAEDMFDLDNLEDLAKETGDSGSAIGWDEAQKLGLLGGNN